MSRSKSIKCEFCGKTAEIITIELEDKAVSFLCWICLFRLAVELSKQAEPVSAET